MNKLLILGGTNFIGRNLIEELLHSNEYEITLFNRQKTNADLFPGLNRIKGDRETSDVNQLKQTKWDYVIDLSCYYPLALEKILKVLNKVDKYVFISTCSVYDNERNKSYLRNEQAEILSCSADQKTDKTTKSYGNRKAECERILKESSQPHVILRPAIVFGKYDPTDRLYYWLHQAKNHKVLLLPENGQRIFSSTYVSDLVKTIIESLNSATENETFNVITHPETSIQQILSMASELLNRKFEELNASSAFLKENNISEWVDMPLWLNCDYYSYSNDKLKTELSLPVTAFRTAIKQTIDYYNQLNWPDPTYGLSPERSQELIEKLTINPD